MKQPRTILLITILATVWSVSAWGQKQIKEVSIDCFGEVMKYEFATTLLVDTNHPESEEELMAYCRQLANDNKLNQLVSELKNFSQKSHIDNWLYYQLIRRVADQIAPKSSDYTLYTLYKWHLLTLSGFDAILTYGNGKILFYVLSKENIYNIPIRKEADKTYICLNYHDYGNIDFTKSRFRKLDIGVPGAENAFSYRVTSIPALKKSENEKELNFTYNNSEYQFRIKLNPSISAYFKNYPSTDYEKHFNIPLSRETYNSLIPALKKYMRGLNPKDGVDFLMHFTRYSFLFKPDTEKYGAEKIYSPEMTLISESSDCEDRVSLFYYLVKEIFDLPMIVVVYPKHVTIAVHFDRSVGKTIEYNGKKFTICEPTPQKEDLKLGETIPDLVNVPYKIAFAYEPPVKIHK
ncbi:MAG TPA: hypothetical protein VLA58_04095 [Chitinophagaceae bacterium]|nr:hypothetical protein [Chitinophagaceae bacterium]